MKLLHQCTLHFQSGKSDKVYEVEVCEHSDGAYLVNFRYGRRGTTLREGTKTPSPVSLEKANQLFEKLMEEKKRKGYTEANAENNTSSPTSNKPIQEPANLQEITEE